MVEGMADLVGHNALDDSISYLSQSFMTDMDSWVASPCIMGGQEFRFPFGMDTKRLLFSLVEVL